MLMNTPRFLRDFWVLFTLKHSALAVFVCKCMHAALT